MKQAREGCGKHLQNVNLVTSLYVLISIGLGVTSGSVSERGVDVLGAVKVFGLGGDVSR